MTFGVSSPNNGVFSAEAILILAQYTLNILSTALENFSKY